MQGEEFQDWGMAQWVKALAAEHENLNSDLSNQVESQVCAHVSVEVARQLFRNYFSPSTYMGPGNQTQAVRFGGKCPYLLSVLPAFQVLLNSCL